MKTLGTILLWAGFLSGALATVINPSQKAVVAVKDMYQSELDRQAQQATLESQLKSAEEVVASSADEVAIEKAKEDVFDVKEALAELPEAPRYEMQDVSQVPLPEDGWNQIPWIWYGISAAVCVVGVVLIQTNKQSAADDEAQDLASIDQLVTSLEKSAEGIKSVQSDLERVPPSQSVHNIDELIVPHLIDFADNREAITKEFGLPVFADVMTDFAAGERAVNRAWSASADGYLDESATCLNRAADMIGSALSKLTKARTS